MIKRFFLPLFILMFLLTGCGVKEPEETTEATLPADAIEIGASSYYCQTEELYEPTGNEAAVSTVFKHSIYDPNYDHIANLTVTVTANHEDGEASIVSVDARLSEEGADDLSISQHLSGDTGTVILYRTQISVCHFQYRVHPDGIIEFL